MIAADWTPPVHPRNCLMEAWENGGLDTIASQLPSLKTASWIGEAFLDRRHHFEKSDFNPLLQTVAVEPQHQWNGRDELVPWYTIWRRWFRQQFYLYVIKRTEIDIIKERLAQNGNVSGSFDAAAIAARKTTLELSLEAFEV